MPDNFEQIKQETNLDIELLKKEIGQRFPFYDMKYDFKTAAFYCRIDEANLENNFDALRVSLKEKGYIPMLRFEKGEHVIYIIKKITKKEKSIYINISLLIAVIITTTLTGSLLYMNYLSIFTDDLELIPNVIEVINPINLYNGFLIFALPLMAILFVHEMGHYYISKRHNISASLPYFIPIPPILPYFNIGTFGALIQSRDPMPDKKALFDVGIAGPLAGFIIALPITAVGIAISEIIFSPDIATGETIFGTSYLFLLLGYLIHNIPFGAEFAMNMHPIAFAGWVGLLITSINLLPAGQLDGGHIFRAFLGEKQKYAGWIAVIIMLFTGWWVFAFIIIFMMGMLHPPPLNDYSNLDIGRKILFFVALIILKDIKIVTIEILWRS
jgi:Zn-dependent protease